MFMDSVFSSFAELAASTVAKRLRASRDENQLGSEPSHSRDRDVEATVQITKTDDDEETIAHVTVAHRPVSSAGDRNKPRELSNPPTGSA